MVSFNGSIAWFARKLVVFMVQTFRNFEWKFKAQLMQAHLIVSIKYYILYDFVEHVLLYGYWLDIAQLIFVMYRR